MITASQLRSLVRSTAPYLFDRPWPKAEFLSILHGPLPAEGDLYGYFAFCLAAHHATVATYVPTDVDSKIRGGLWRQTGDRELLRRMADLALRWASWDLSFLSRRWIDNGFGPVSGHDGERLSVWAGALGRLVETADEEYEERLARGIEQELARELASFEAARDPVEQLKLAQSIAHNLGDLNQGIGYWKKDPRMNALRKRFHRLGHQQSGQFAAPMRLYRELLAAEGHRNYPLRAVKALRQDPSLLYPQAPFVDSWGETVATSPLLTWEDRRQVAQALIEGCRRLPAQQGYYRALAGMQTADSAQFERIIDTLPATARKLARTADFRKQLAVPRASFESSLAKRAAALLREPGLSSKQSWSIRSARDA